MWICQGDWTSPHLHDHLIVLDTGNDRVFTQGSRQIEWSGQADRLAATEDGEVQILILEGRSDHASNRRGNENEWSFVDEQDRSQES